MQPKAHDLTDFDDRVIPFSPSNENSGRTDAPQPLRRELQPAKPYPVDALGGLMGRAVAASAKVIDAPVELCAQSALANASLAVQGRANVLKPWAQRKPGPISLFLLSVAESGDRKTTTDDALGGDTIREHETRLADETHLDRQRYESAKDAYDIAKKAAKDNAAKGNDNPREAVQAALESLGEPPVPPLDAAFVFGDPTIEGLHKHFANAQPSAGLFSSEGGAFVGGTGMTKENALRTSAQFSELWDGTPIKRLRAMDGMLVLRNRRLSFHLMMQPGAAQAWLSDPIIRDQGLFSRMLVAAPKSLAGTRFHKAPTPDDLDTMAMFNAHLRQLLEVPLPINPDKPGELMLRDVHVAAEAEKLLYAFYDDVEGQLGEGGPLVHLKGLAGKIIDHAVRLSAVLGLFENPALLSIDRPLMARGITLAGWYLGEALRLMDAEAQSPELINAEKVLAWLREHGRAPLFSLPCIYMKGPAAVRSKASAKAVISILLDHGQIERVSGSHVVDGARRSECYRVRKA